MIATPSGLGWLVCSWIGAVAGDSVEGHIKTGVAKVWPRGRVAAVNLGSTGIILDELG